MGTRELGFPSVPAQTSLMAAGAGESLGVERLLSYADDLLGVFRVSTDRDGNAQVGAGARRLVSGCRSEYDDLELQIKGPLVPCPTGIHFALFRRFRCFSSVDIGVFLV